MIQKPKFLIFFKILKLFLYILILIFFVSITIKINKKKIQSHFIQGRIDLSKIQDNENRNLNYPLFTIHFFDWFHYENLEKSTNKTPLDPNYQTHPIDWNAIGVSLKDLGKFKYYDNNFKLIKKTGIDAITWEFYKHKNGKLTMPTEDAIHALLTNNLKIGIFYDWELIHAADKALLSSEAYVTPTQENIDKVSNEISAFYTSIPKKLWFINSADQVVIFVYAFGYDTKNNNLEDWNWFYSNLSQTISKKINMPIKIYLTGLNVIQQETAFINFPQFYEPFNFVLDQPQQLFGNDVATWNFGFDNFGAAKRDNTRRMIRLDGRYWQEMYDLIFKQKPEIVFMYSWNEPFEGSTLIPATDYKFTRINFVEKMINSIKHSDLTKTPKTLTIIDKYPQCILENDWHCKVEKDFLLYHLKRFFPDSDVLATDDISSHTLNIYQYIIDLSAYKNISTEELLSRLPPEKVLIYFDPLLKSTHIKSNFFTKTTHQTLNRSLKIMTSNCPDSLIFSRDDVAKVSLNSNSKTLIWSFLPRLPLLVSNNNDYYINSYTPNYCILSTLVKNIFNRPIENQILYGEGFESQNIVIENNEYKKNQFNRPGIIEHKLFIPKELIISIRDFDSIFINFAYKGLD